MTRVVLRQHAVSLRVVALRNCAVQLPALRRIYILNEIFRSAAATRLLHLADHVFSGRLRGPGWLYLSTGVCVRVCVATFLATGQCHINGPASRLLSAGPAGNEIR